MRKVTRQVCSAFLQGKRATIGNTSTDGQRLFLHGNLIAEKVDRDAVRLTDAGWQSNTTKERLNGLLTLMNSPAGIYQKNYRWRVYHRGQDLDNPWLGEYRATIRPA